MSEPVAPCPTCPEGWRPLDKEHCADCYEGKIERLNTRIEALEAALRFLLDTKWKSVDKDNMEFEGHVTCYQLDKARNALEPEQDK